MDTEWVKERLILLHKTHEDVARHLNKHRTVATKIINGEQPLKINQITAFAQCLETTIPIILEKLGLDITNAESETHQIPILSPEDVAKIYAYPDNASIYPRANHAPVSYSYLTLNSYTDSLLAMSIGDESMNRLAEIGSVIVIDRNQTELIDHHLYVFHYNKMGLFRRFRERGLEKWMEPDSLNPRFTRIFQEYWHSPYPMGKVIAIYSNKALKQISCN